MIDDPGPNAWRPTGERVFRRFVVFSVATELVFSKKRLQDMSFGRVPKFSWLAAIHTGRSTFGIRKNRRSC